MQRAAVMLVAVLCYFAFFVSFVYFVGFVAGLPLLPTHVDKGIVAGTGTAFIVDVLLISLFGFQHSIMARKPFKAALTRHVPPALERSLYCLASAVALGIMFAFWHPIPAPIWHVADPTGRVLLWILFGLGFGVVFISTWLISHFELFGLAQAWSHFRGTMLTEQRFRTPLFYAAVRHPIYLGFLLALWSTPDMSAGHLLLALGLTGYILVGIRYEERDLVSNFGATYVEYRERVGMVIPRIRRS
jgi:protein-S-isoprenylcysteine O-methyltransferase Ste14